MPPFDSPTLIWQRLRHPACLVVALLLLWFLLESLIYRSGFYYHLLAEPHSNAGSTMLRSQLARREATLSPPTVLLFGDSRVGQGFSRATAQMQAPGFAFINVAVPGSTARTWFYLLRKMQREAVPFDVVVVGVLYQPMGAGRWADRSLDPAFMAPLTDLRDAVEFPASFDDPAIRQRAHHMLWLPALQMQKDTQALLTSPRERRRSLRGKRWWLENIGNYPGREGTMPVLEFDPQGRVVDWGDATPEQRTDVQDHLAVLAQKVAVENNDFLDHWIGKMLVLVRQNKARLIFYPLPRGPYAQLLPEQTGLPPWLEALSREPDVTVLPADFFADLEAPEYFFDELHANTAARRITSERVAWAVAEVMSEAQPRNDGAAQP